MSLAAPMPTLVWGTNRVGGIYYAGRTHVVWPGGSPIAVCGLPVSDLWEHRPPIPSLLCPDCCLMAIARAYPPFPMTRTIERTAQGPATTAFSP